MLLTGKTAVIPGAGGVRGIGGTACRPTNAVAASVKGCMA